MSPLPLVTEANSDALAYPAVLAGNAADDEERRSDQHPDEEDDHDGASWQRCRGVGAPGDRVEEAEGEEQRAAENAAGQNDVAHLRAEAHFRFP